MGNFQKYWSQNVGQDFLALDFFHGRNILKVDGRDPQNREKNAPAGRFTCMCLMVMHPHTKYHWPISKQKCYSPDKKILFKKQLFDLEVKDQGPTKVITVCDAPTYQINTIFKNNLFNLEVKGQGPTKVITVHDTPPYGHAPTYQISLTYLER